MRHLAPVALLVAAAACADLRHYAPRENPNGIGPTGNPAAVYPLATATDPTAGELRLWSNGSRGENVDSPPDGGRTHRVELHVGFELENTGAVPLELTAIRSGDPALALVRTAGEPFARPGRTTRFDTWFLAPAARSTADVPEFAVRYQVFADGAPILTQSTPFATWIPPDPRGYDPFFFGPPFGLHFVFGWHGHYR